MSKRNKTKRNKTTCVGCREKFNIYENDMVYKPDPLSENDKPVWLCRLCYQESFLENIGNSLVDISSMVYGPRDELWKEK